MNPRPRLAFPVLASLVLGASFDAGVARAQDQTPSPFPTQDWIGIEVSPLSFNVGSAPDGSNPTRVQPGLGGSVRLLKHRWSRAYVTPIQAGGFVGETGNQTVVLHADAEAGLIISVNRNRQAFELGLAAGVGIVSIPYNNYCDGSCNVGGAGPLLSPVARYVAWGSGHFTAGITLRGLIPLVLPSGNWFGYYTGRGALFLASVDLAFGS